MIFKVADMILICYVIISGFFLISMGVEDIWEEVACNADFEPENCDFEKISRLTVEDFDRCGPARLNSSSRELFLGAAGRRITYNDNKEAFRRIKIVPKLLRDVSKSSLEVSTLGQRLDIPIGFSPVAFQKLAHPLGEIATVRALSNISAVMILSSIGTTTIEELARHAKGGKAHLWMQTYIFKNRSITVDIVSRAERAGFKAIVVTIDSPVTAKLTCNGRRAQPRKIINIPGQGGDVGSLIDDSLTFRDLAWLTSITKLPIVAKGILSGFDAWQAIGAGVSAIFVSNHGGRQMDSAPAVIDVLPDIVDVVNSIMPRRDVYVDSGIRNGWDVYKAIASGAKMVFIGRPVIWGLAENGENGVREIVNILRTEFEEVMKLAGASDPSKISGDSLIRTKSNC